MNTLNNLLVDIASERRSQDETWGEQNHPSVTKPGDGSSWLSENVCQWLNDRAVSKNELSWAHIATEELAEVIGAKDELHRRQELIQLAAVCVAWAECIDRNNLGV